jgi:hypothetical protein
VLNSVHELKPSHDQNTDVHLGLHLPVGPSDGWRPNPECGKIHGVLSAIGALIAPLVAAYKTAVGIMKETTEFREARLRYRTAKEEYIRSKVGQAISPLPPQMVMFRSGRCITVGFENVTKHHRSEIGDLDASIQYTPISRPGDMLPIRGVWLSNSFLSCKGDTKVSRLIIASNTPTPHGDKDGSALWAPYSCTDFLSIPAADELFGGPNGTNETGLLVLNPSLYSVTVKFAVENVYKIFHFRLFLAKGQLELQSVGLIGRLAMTIRRLWAKVSD